MLGVNGELRAKKRTAARVRLPSLTEAETHAHGAETNAHEAEPNARRGRKRTRTGRKRTRTGRKRTGR